LATLRCTRQSGDLWASSSLIAQRSKATAGVALEEKEILAFGVSVKLKTTDFQLLTRQHRLSEPTHVTERLYSVGVELLDEINHPGPFRLVGMAAYDLVGINDRIQLDLFGSFARQRGLEAAIDKLVARFGPNVVHRANNLPKSLRLGSNPDFLDERTRGLNEL
jgi:DNA polymerase IV